MRLLGQEDRAHAAFANWLQKLVRAKDYRAASAQRREVAIQRDGWGFQKSPDACVCLEQAFDVFKARGITAADPHQIGRSLGGIGDIARCMEDVALGHGSLLDRLATI
jgi:hypothetical protein